MRPYTDLITEITVDGEMFIPIKQIAALAFAYKPECIEYQYNICHNPYFEEVHYLFSTRNGVDCQLHIDKYFNMSLHFIIGNSQITQRSAVKGQVEIFKLLTKWGFI